MSRHHLCLWAFRKGLDGRYTEFTIPKRNGSTRVIHAPKEPLLLIQKKLLDLHQALDTFSSSAHGFRKGKSIVTNAGHHIRKTLVLKVDIKDFFPSITFKRLKGLLMMQPFGYPLEVAVIIAKLCTHDGFLPQGSPMSPFLSNMFMRAPDSIFRRYAKDHRFSYTRYADDITFSTTTLSFPTGMVDSSGSGAPGFIEMILRKRGFQVNEKKTRLLDRKRRMCVTGVVVNRKSNVPRDYIRRIRVLIHLVEKLGVEKATDHFLKNLDERAKHRKITKDLLLNVIRGRIAHVSNVRGRDDLLVQSLRDRLTEAIDPGSLSPFAAFRKQWNELKAEKVDSVRGYMFEKLWTSLVNHEGIQILKSYRTAGEQVDGLIQVNGIHYLVECKAGGKPTPMKDLDTFAGKIYRRPQGTRGLFISVAGYVEQAPQLAKEYPGKPLTLLTSAHLEAVLAQKATLTEIIMRATTAQIGYRITIYDPYEENGYKELKASS